MSPTFLNENTHAVYVDGDNGDVKLAAGQAKDVSGKAADQLKGMRNVRTLTGDEAKAALERPAGGSTDGDLSGELGNVVAGAVGELSQLATAAPLRVVVGDDQAPYGPPSGTVSTKGIEAAKDEAHRRQFADGEAIAKVGEQEQPPHGIVTHDVVHNAQVDAAESAEDLARMIAQGIGSGLPDEVEDDGGDDVDNLSGEALDAAVSEADIAGRSSMSADEKRAALREHRAAAAA